MYQAASCEKMTLTRAQRQRSSPSSSVIACEGKRRVQHQGSSACRLLLAGATLPQTVLPVLVAIVIIELISLLAERVCQKFSAVFLTGVSAAYLSGGFGFWEFALYAVIMMPRHRDWWIAQIV